MWVHCVDFHLESNYSLRDKTEGNSCCLGDNKFTIAVKSSKYVGFFYTEELDLSAMQYLLMILYFSRVFVIKFNAVNRITPEVFWV